MDKEDKNIIKNNSILQKYIEEFQKDVFLDIYNLREKSLMSSSIWAKWLSYLFLEKENKQRILAAKQKILEKKMQEAKNKNSLLKVKDEAAISENDENIKKLNDLFSKTQDNIDYIERALGILSNFGFNIKNSIDLLKLQQN